MYMNKKYLSLIFPAVLIVTIFISVFIKICYHNNIDVKENKLVDTPAKFHHMLSKSNLLSNMTTPYSVLYGKDKTRQMYVFSVPIQEKINAKHSLMENKIVKNKNEFITTNKTFNISFNTNKINLKNSQDSFEILIDNIKTIQQNNDYTNIYEYKGKSIKYTDKDNNILFCFPTYNGLLMEYNLNSSKQRIEFELNLNEYEFLNDEAGYVQLLKNSNEKMGIIYQGIITDKNNKFLINNKAEIVKRNNKFYLSYKLPQNMEYPIKFIINIDFYSEKMFFDTSNYNTSPKTNFIFNNISFFDTQIEDAQEQTYVKFNLKSITPKSAELLNTISLNFYAIFSEGELDIEVFKVQDEWCSWTMNWNEQPDYYEKIGEINVNKSGWYSLDITEYAKELINNNYDQMIDNSIVLIAKRKSEGRAIFASADNSCAPPYFKIDYKVS